MSPTIGQMWVASIPDWLGEAIASVVCLVLGFTAKSMIDYFRASRAKSVAERDRLFALSDMLAESRSIFLSQNYLARRLMRLLHDRFAEPIRQCQGFDDAFTKYFDKMNQDEQELHALIRSTTMNSLRQINERLRAWLTDNPELLRKNQSTDEGNRLAKSLNDLQLHLNQWFDKYEAWIPTNKKRTLVYLADEKEQGMGFPEELGPALEVVLKRMA